MFSWYNGTEGQLTSDAVVWIFCAVTINCAMSTASGITLVACS